MLMYTEYGYIGKADGIEYSTEQEAIEANPSNQSPKRGIAEKLVSPRKNLFFKNINTVPQITEK